MSRGNHTPGPWEVITGSAVVMGGQVVITTTAPDGADQFERYANARLIAASPAMLSELEKAHRMLYNALQIMSVEQKAQWGAANARDGVDGEGVTRANERLAVITEARA